MAMADILLTSLFWILIFLFFYWRTTVVVRRWQEAKEDDGIVDREELKNIVTREYRFFKYILGVFGVKLVLPHIDLGELSE